MYLLDTNALSKLVKKRPHPGFVQFPRIPNLRVEDWIPSRA
jgi:hypothetical protein